MTFVDSPEDLSSDVSGPDLDNNGVRDDIDTFIELNFASNTVLSAEVTQLARAQQTYMVSTSESEVLKSLAAVSLSLTCLHAELKTKPEDFSLIVDTIAAWTANTRERYLALSASDKMMQGQDIVLMDESECGNV